ncbi:hypothetical protein EIP91_005576 [Steccherinum ochraceum]|uniref:NAD(P)-binding protein n=1 Tax=Steccherinum ochraceum TaxID=92696 RepID=A0A4V2MXG1_9APHY|nr:hypothetical protein EIP91_005576 [Steccherinum ochraceum]
MRSATADPLADRSTTVSLLTATAALHADVQVYRNGCEVVERAMSKANISHSRCVLVIGATAGIGRDLAIAIHDLPSKPTVIVTGRRQDRLDELTGAHERMRPARFDMTAGRAAIKQFVEDIVKAYPELDTVIFSAGIQHIFNFQKPEEIDLDILETELTTNYTSIVSLIVLLLPHLLKLSKEGRPSFIVPITSNLGLFPRGLVPNYCATKAAMHSFALSLDNQLQGTNVNVMEIIPPLVESELHDHQGSTARMSQFWMPLTEFTQKAMEGLLRGDMQIPVGVALDTWTKFEKPKLEAVADQARKAIHNTK